MSNPYASPEDDQPGATKVTAAATHSNRRQQVNIVVAMYVSYAMFMVLRMAPGVAGTSIVDDPSLNVDKGDLGRILAMGTGGAVLGKFISGYAADKLGGRLTFAIGLLVSGLGIGAFAASTQVWMFQATFFVALMAKSSGWPSMAKIIVTTFRPSEYGRVWGVLATSSRAGTLVATFCLGGLLSQFSWQAMFYFACGAAILLAACFYVAIGRATRQLEPSLDLTVAPEQNTAVAHPLDDTDLLQAIGRFCASRQFWLIVGSLMGLTILWDFLLFVPLYLKETLGMSPDKASMASSAFPLGSLISVLGGGYFFDKLNRRATAWLMGLLLTLASGCILTFYLMPQFNMSETGMVVLSLVLLFIFGMCVSPCYYIPMSVFSIEFGGPHSGFLIALLDGLAFGATGAFYYFAGEWAKESWTLFLFILLGVSLWSMLTTLFFMLGEARIRDQKASTQNN